jgi:hypothetical protein
MKRALIAGITGEDGHRRLRSSQKSIDSKRSWFRTASLFGRLV